MGPRNSVAGWLTASQWVPPPPGGGAVGVREEVARMGHTLRAAEAVEGTRGTAGARAGERPEGARGGAPRGPVIPLSEKRDRGGISLLTQHHAVSSQ